MRLRLAAFLALIAGLQTALPAKPAHAFELDRNVKYVFIASGWGTLAGTFVGGVTMLVGSQQAKTMFLGSSVGLYLGIVVGVFYAIYRNDPQNPLRPKYPDKYGGQSGLSLPITRPPALVTWEFELASF